MEYEICKGKQGRATEKIRCHQKLLHDDLIKCYFNPLDFFNMLVKISIPGSFKETVNEPHTGASLPDLYEGNFDVNPVHAR